MTSKMMSYVGVLGLTIVSFTILMVINKIFLYLLINKLYFTSSGHGGGKRKFIVKLLGDIRPC